MKNIYIFVNLALAITVGGIIVFGVQIETGFGARQGGGPTTTTTTTTTTSTTTTTTPPPTTTSTTTTTTTTTTTSDSSTTTSMSTATTSETQTSSSSAITQNTSATTKSSSTKTSSTPEPFTSQTTQSKIVQDKNSAVADGVDKITLTVTVVDSTGKIVTDTPPSVEISGKGNSYQMKQEGDGFIITITSTEPGEKIIKISDGTVGLPEVKGIFTQKETVVTQTNNQDNQSPVTEELTVLKKLAQNSIFRGIQKMIYPLATIAVILPPLLNGLLNIPLLSPFAGFFAYFLPWFRRNRPKAWGTVLDSESGQPLALVAVRLFDKEKNKVVDTQLTDKDGRFGFLVEPGRYFLQAVKKNYDFPSHIKNEEYHGGPVEIKEEGLTKLNIFLDPKLNVLSARINVLNIFLNIVKNLRLPLLTIGTIIALMFYFVDSNLYNLAIIALYAIIWLYDLANHFAYVKSFGKIRDAVSSEELNLAIVRLFNESSGKLIATRVSSRKGDYSMLVQAGRYHLNITRAQYQQLQDTSEYFKKAAIIAKDYKLKPL